MLNTPIVYPGAKRNAVRHIFSRVGDAYTYIEPMVGSCSYALPLANPHGIPPSEILNDICGYVANFGRAVKHNPHSVAFWADRQTSHCDLIAARKHLNSVRDTLIPWLDNDIEHHDAKTAGLWAFACSAAIGMAGDVTPESRVGGELAGLVRSGNPDDAIPRISAANDGQGVAALRRDTLTAETTEQNWVSSTPKGSGRGVLPQVSPKQPSVQPDGSGRGILPKRKTLPESISIPYQGARLLDWICAIGRRLERTYILRKNWETLFSPTMLGQTSKGGGLTDIVFDPDYSEYNDAQYAQSDRNMHIAIQDKALELAENPLNRIVLCGYAAMYPNIPDTWERVVWRKNAPRMGSRDLKHDRTETLWFSPSCAVQRADKQGVLPIADVSTLPYNSLSLICSIIYSRIYSKDDFTIPCNQDNRKNSSANH